MDRRWPARFLYSRAAPRQASSVLEKERDAVRVMGQL